MSILRLVLCVLVGATALHARVSHADEPPTTPIGDVLAMPPETLAKKPTVRVRGVVTYYRPEGSADLIVQDDSGGVFVSEARPDAIPRVRPGSLVEIEGEAGEGNFSPRVRVQKLTVLGEDSLPAPAAVSLEELRTGRFDCRYVELTGVVRWAAIDRRLSPPRLLARVAVPSGAIDAWVLRFAEEDAHGLVDAVVSVRGVCIAWNNPRRQLHGLRLLVSDAASVSVVRPAPGDPFAAPLVSLDRLLRYRPEGVDRHRVRVRGIVTSRRAGELVVQQARLGVRVAAASSDSVETGDEIEVAGFPELIGGSAGLTDAVFRVIGRSGEPAPFETTARRMIEDDAAHDADQRLVRLPGVLRAVYRDAENATLLLEDEGTSFHASLDRDAVGDSLDALELGSRLSVTGVCEVHSSERVLLLGGHPDGFAVRLRRPSDVVVLAAGPWLTTRRLATIAGVALAALLIALAWGLLLRRLVARRTRRLVGEIRSRRDARLEFDAVLAERNRVAADLHDTLHQCLTATALQLDAATLALKSGAASATEHVSLARTHLDRTREELHRSVWNLRHEPHEAPADLLAELRELAEGLTLGTGLDVRVEATGATRPLPEPLVDHALRVAREAVTNAIRHGKARTIRVAAAFDDRRLTLRVEDDGRGFDPTVVAGSDAGHFGLDGMRDRARRLGGTLDVASSPGGGATITLTAPLTDAIS